VAGFNSEDRLKELTLPVLIVSGDADRVLPVENSYLLQQRIMNSRLHIFPGAGHLFFIEEPERFNRLLLNFMSEEDD
jgi:pimeloyl-ACP methyl ester carboxylesterase